MPKKPTSPFGYISFGKDGSVEKYVEVLPPEKDKQERRVVDSFVVGYNERNPNSKITNVEPLPENDHDFVLRDAKREILLQVTELVDRTYTFQMSREEYDQCQWREAVLKESGQIPWRVDTKKRDAALDELIQKKQGKHYAKDPKRDLWLLVFTTDELYLTEYYRQGAIHVSPALQLARARLTAQSAEPFAQVWFSSMTTNPVRVWPTT